MRKPLSFDYCCRAPRHCLSRMTKTEQGNRHKRLRCHPRVDTGLSDERGIRAGIAKCEGLLQMQTGRGKPAGKHQIAPERLVRQNKPRSVVALSAQAQQIFVQTMRQIQFAADLVIERLRIGNPKELRRRTQLLPQLSCSAKRSSCFRRSVAFNGLQHDAQRTLELELLALTCEILR